MIGYNNNKKMGGNVLVFLVFLNLTPDDIDSLTNERKYTELAVSCTISKKCEID